ncbi:MAG: hypothetical protein FJW66_02505 [Actinobacteria bacterium]|nr:hypothetical protein [Actinomycetota bacterium]
MNSLEITGLVAIILISSFAVAGIIISVPLFRLINRIRHLADKLNESLVPIVEKLNNTVSHLNTEIGSISELTQSVSSIVEQLEKIIRLARIIITNPIIKLISAGVGFADGIKKTASKEKNKT